MSRIHRAALAAALVLVAPAVQAAQTQPPSFLAGTGAEPLAITEMETVRGEGLPAYVVKLVVRRVTVAVSKAAGMKIAGLFEGGRTPTYREYKAAFGTKTALVLQSLNALPLPILLLVKPNFAS